MRCNVLRGFVYSTDGVHPIEAVPGGAAEIPDALVAGLVAEGFVSVAEAGGGGEGSGGDDGAGGDGAADGSEGTGDGGESAGDGAPARARRGRAWG